jgi:thiosulfate dehydrogenase
MVTAWEVPDNPLRDATLGASPLADDIRWGFRIFTDTPAEATRFTAGQMSCNNCHLNGGQREQSLPLVAIAGLFPEYNKRTGRQLTLPERIVECFLRSENAVGRLAQHGELPTATSREVLAVSAYVTWLSRNARSGKQPPPWRGKNVIPAASLVPPANLDRMRGEAMFVDRCAPCHRRDGQGIAFGDKKAGPLWGPASWNDGAGAARVYTLAGYIRYAMPYFGPGSLTDEEAQQLAAFIDSKPRPAFPFKGQDYRGMKVPVDAVYYTRPAQ